MTEKTIEESFDSLAETLKELAVARVYLLKIEKFKLVSVFVKSVPQTFGA